MSDLEKVLDEARKAREEAATATQRAAELEAQAEAARQQARQARAQQQRDWAQRTVDSYESNLSAADVAIQEAQRRFIDTVPTSLDEAVKAYLAWGEAVVRHYTLQVQAATAAPLLSMEATQAEFASPPPFSQALDDALNRHLAKLSQTAREAASKEIAAIFDEGDAAGASAETSPTGPDQDRRQLGTI